MKGHVDNGTIIRMHSGLITGRRHAELQRHIDDCDRCRKRAAAIAALMQQPPAGLRTPPERVRNRILQSYYEIKNAPAGASPINRMLHSWKAPALALAATIVIVVGAAVFFDRWLFDRSGHATVAIDIAGLSGEILVNGTMPEGTIRIKPHDTITVGKDGAVRLAYAGIFTITLDAESEFIVEKASSPHTGAYEFAFRLNHGSLLSQFAHGDFSCAYSYHTPRGTVSSTGTEFVLVAGPSETIVLLNEGAVRLTPSGRNEWIRVVERKRYAIARSITTSELGPGDLRAIDDMGAKRDSMAPANRESGDRNGRTRDTDMRKRGALPSDSGHRSVDGGDNGFADGSEPVKPGSGKKAEGDAREPGAGDALREKHEADRDADRRKDLKEQGRDRRDSLREKRRDKREQRGERERRNR
ncbi:MAG TPA: FecR domain-containing protein [Spirochaetota bacterium]|nr:FecR domain-containing protein [Spirochaetota bacterium]HNT11903.1 FecR domain-containing protein [Spirochaetota bacterium]